jgi:hypothetical protein
MNHLFTLLLPSASGRELDCTSCPWSFPGAVGEVSLGRQRGCDRIAGSPFG